MLLPTTVEEYYKTCGWEMPKPGTIESENPEMSYAAPLSEKLLRQVDAARRDKKLQMPTAPRSLEHTRGSLMEELLPPSDQERTSWVGAQIRWAKDSPTLCRAERVGQALLGSTCVVCQIQAIYWTHLPDCDTHDMIG